MMATRPHILLADSDINSQRSLRAFFERRGWDFDVAPTVHELSEALQRDEYDIIIADASMPGLGPAEVLGQSYKKHPSQLLIVVAESLARGEELKLLRSGVTDILSKPVDLEWLERCIDQSNCYRRLDEREKMSYALVTSERTEMKFSCSQLQDIQVISPPILNRLVATSKLSHVEGLRLRLALQEAILNAVEHGNLELESEWKEEVSNDGVDKFSRIRAERLADPAYASKVVTLTCWYNGETLEMTIKDQGKGFLNSKPVVTTQAENLSCSGRGMTLMTHAVDEVRFDDNGSEVTLVKHLSESRGR